MLGATEVHPMFLGLFLAPTHLGIVPISAPRANLSLFHCAMPDHLCALREYVLDLFAALCQTMSAPCARMPLVSLHRAMPKNVPDLQRAVRENALRPRMPHYRHCAMLNHFCAMRVYAFGLDSLRFRR